ncbi:exportin-2-like [Corticium candelabrum]|uniref:exportin-2-like n=1 Tax=Corticium candelabrum TaxID=121492 RepID=UPI002E26C73B|nr:exportin-2-like [Corticium candelabrum]
MEMNEQNLQALAGYLQKTLSPDPTVRKPAERFLESVEGHANYPILLLHLIEADSVESSIRIAAAISFKNFVRRNWRTVEDHDNRISDGDRSTVRRLIVSLMLKTPERIQVQLSEAIGIIGREDFPDKWPELLTELVEKFSSGDVHVINGVLKTAHSLFRRYRHEMKSDVLWLEIKFVLEKFATPLTSLLQHMMTLVHQHSSDPAALKILFSSLTLVSKIFYSLNYQDLPEYFEDNMQTWMDSFYTLLMFNSKLLQTDDDDEAGPIELIRSQICDNIAMYAQKYDEEFGSHLPRFVSAVWELLVTTGLQVKYDLLVSNAIQFLASVAERANYKQLFESEDTLRGICEKVVVPNIHFRDSDEEVFEDNPEEYIRRDIEGSDIDTRRRAACDLVRALCRHFEAPVIEIFSSYVTSLLTEYSKSPVANWRSKDAAIYLVTSLATRSKTQKHGTTEASELVNIGEFYTNQIKPHLESPQVNELPVLKADSVKYILTFRSLLSRDLLAAAVPCLTNLVASRAIVVHSYAASCLERLFTMRTVGGGSPFSPAEVQPITEALLTNLFSALTLRGSEENEYIMKAIMRTLVTLKEAVLPYIPIVLQQLVAKLEIVTKNPSKPHFNHYLFEALCCTIRATCRQDASAIVTFEEALFPIFQGILTRDVLEFMPYVFQILSLLLEVRPAPIPDSYMQLYPHLLTPVLWDRQSNVPGLVRLLQAYVCKGSESVAESDKLMPLLGVFQKLIASKNNDHEGFYILSSLVEHLPIATLAGQLKSVFVILFQRLQNSKTTKYVKGLLVFFCLFAGKHGGNALVTLIEDIQPKLFGMVIEKLFVPDVQRVSGHTERKICAVGMTRVLTEADSLLSVGYSKLWVQLLQSLVQLFELPEDDSVPDDEHFIEIEDTPGYQAAYSQLVFAGKQERDPFKLEYENPKANLAKSLHKLSLSHQGKLTPLLTGNMTHDALQYLTTYLQAANITSLA